MLDRYSELTRVVEITPEMARYFLDRNIANNRYINQRRVDVYVKDMRDGNFKFNGESIKISKNGKLIDGQHRLHACVKAGVPFKSVVVEGLEETVFTTIDIGKKRSPGDALTHMGFSNANSTAAAIRWVRILNSDVATRGGNEMKAAEIVDFAKYNPSIVESVKFVMGQAGLTHRLAPPSLLIALHYKFSLKTRAGADAFFAKLASGEGPPDDPIVMLRNRLISIGLSRAAMAGAKNFADMAGLAIHAWNAYREGRSLQRLQGLVTKNGNRSWPEIV